uniref:Putative ovule protein n=1 Tax=Solanum chacoense TaxID=4108 RepID=A0A0V0HM38_SOLCH
MLIGCHPTLKHRALWGCQTPCLVMLIGLHHIWKALWGCQTTYPVMLIGQHHTWKALRVCETTYLVMRISLHHTWKALHGCQTPYLHHISLLILFHLLPLLILHPPCTGRDSFALGRHCF